MGKTRGDRLRIAREKRFPSARAAALALGVPVSTYGAHERAQAPGGRDFGPDEAERYARRFKVSPEWLLTGAAMNGADQVLDTPVDNGDSAGTVPVVGYVGAGAKAHYYSLERDELDTVPAPEGTTPETVAVEIRGSSLGPMFDRWLAFYDNVQRPATEDLIGKLCVIGLSDERVLIKRLERGRRKGLYRLMSNTEPPIEDVPIEWAARVKNMVPRP